MPEREVSNDKRMNEVVLLNEQRQELIVDISSIFRMTPDKIDLLREQTSKMLVYELVQRWCDLHADSIIKSISADDIQQLVAQRLRDKFIDILKTS